MKNRVWTWAGLAVIGLGVGYFLATTETSGEKPTPTVVKQTTALSDPAEVPTIDAAELQNEMKSNTPPVLVDVREPAEHAVGAIDGDTNIPLGELPQHIAELPKDKLIVVYCRSGRRSANAVELLHKNGYLNVRSLNGGMNEWTRQIEPGKKTCC